MKILIAVALMAVAVLAQDPDDLVKRAKQLENRAAKALDAGRNVEAFELLAQAEELRRQARAATPAKPLPQAKKAAPPPQPPKKKKKAKRAPAVTDPVTKAFASLDRAIEKGDQVAARQASKQLKKLVRKQFKAPPPAADKALMERVERLEKQIAELRQLLAQIDR